MLEGALSGPIETKCLMYVNASDLWSLQISLLGFNRKNLSLRGRATELNCSTKHHCAYLQVPVCSNVTREQCKVVPREKCSVVTNNPIQPRARCQINTRLVCEDKPRQKCGNKVLLIVDLVV